MRTSVRETLAFLALSEPVKARAPPLYSVSFDYVCAFIFFFSLEASNYSRCHREGRSGRNLVADTASPVVAELINSVFCEQFVPLSYKEEQLGGNKVKVTRFRACYGDFP